MIRTVSLLVLIAAVAGIIAAASLRKPPPQHCDDFLNSNLANCNMGKP